MTHIHVSSRSCQECSELLHPVPVVNFYYIKLKFKGQSVGSKTRMKTNGRTDGRTPRSTDCFTFLTKAVENKLHRLTGQDSRLAHCFALLWGPGLLVEYLASSGAKSDVIFLLGDPDFLMR